MTLIQCPMPDERELRRRSEVNSADKKLCCRGCKTTFKYAFSIQALARADRILNLSTRPIPDQMGMAADSTIQCDRYPNPTLAQSNSGTTIRTPGWEPHLTPCNRSLVSPKRERKDYRAKIDGIMLEVSRLTSNHDQLSYEVRDTATEVEKMSR